jgi:hypothetical protein
MNGRELKNEIAKVTDRLRQLREHRENLETARREILLAGGERQAARLALIDKRPDRGAVTESIPGPAMAAVQQGYMNSLPGLNDAITEITLLEERLALLEQELTQVVSAEKVAAGQERIAELMGQAEKASAVFESRIPSVREKLLALAEECWELDELKVLADVNGELEHIEEQLGFDEGQRAPTLQVPPELGKHLHEMAPLVKGTAASTRLSAMTRGRWDQWLQELRSVSSETEKVA